MCLRVCFRRVWRSIPGSDRLGGWTEYTSCYQGFKGQSWLYSHFLEDSICLLRTPGFYFYPFGVSLLKPPPPPTSPDHTYPVHMKKKRCYTYCLLSFSLSSPQPGGDLNMKRAFLKEAAVMGQFRHKNIIKLIGICSGTESKFKVQSCNTNNPNQVALIDDQFKNIREKHKLKHMTLTEIAHWKGMFSCNSEFQAVGSLQTAFHTGCSQLQSSDSFAHWCSQLQSSDSFAHWGVHSYSYKGAQSIMALKLSRPWGV